jgi:CRP/FNR family cyclic AMP-dependent transcriptional regulator
LQQIAFWSSDLSDQEIEQARRGMVEKAYAKGAYICHRGDRLDSWTGVVSGLIKLSTVSRSGKAVSLAGIRAGGWFGEGTVLKNEPRQYDLVALRDTRMALMDRATFLWLFENSVAFNRFLISQFNERLGQFIALVEYDRMLDAPARVARNIAWLFNPTLYRDHERHLEISQEEIGLLSGVSRPVANKSLKMLEDRGLLRLERGGISVLNLAALGRFGD